MSSLFARTLPSPFKKRILLAFHPMLFEKITADSLFVSEPNPLWFGNPTNPRDLPKEWTCSNWLQSRFHFSFAEYNDRKRNQFGVLRVLNDDLVQPARGFGTHPHRNMEICTYVVNGELSHQDSMGTCESLGRGSIQFMTAGTGVQHSERNLSPTDPLRFIQMWIVPRRSGLAPNYGSASSSLADRKNRLAHLVSDIENTTTQTPVKIYQDCNMYVTELDAGKQVEFNLERERQVYMVCLEGQVRVELQHGKEGLDRHEALKIRGGAGEAAIKVTITADENQNSAHVLLVEMSS